MWTFLIIIEGYVADEIITSAAGTRVRVGNTDAEGRMAMADSLHRMKCKVSKQQKMGLAPLFRAPRV